MWQGDDAPETSPASAAAPGGVYVLDIVVNVVTSILCAALPHFDPEKPLQGTKPARLSILKLLTGMCNDVNPLNYRDKEEKDRVTPDPYYEGAPGWTSLSGGRKPYITKAPAELAAMIKRACDCVPFVRAVRFFTLDAQGNQQQVTLEELQAMNIQVKPVPNLYKRAAAAAAAAGAGSSTAAAAPSMDMTPIFDRQRALERELAHVRAGLSATTALAAQVQEMKELMMKMAAAMPAPAPATAPAVEPPPSAAPSAEPSAEEDGDEDDSIQPPSKKARKSCAL